MALKKPVKLGKYFKMKASKSKVQRFSAGVDELIRRRHESGNPNLGRIERTGQLSPKALKKVSQRKVNRFGRNLNDYKAGGKKELEFKGINATQRNLNKKRLSKVTEKQLKKFDKRK